MSKIKTYYKNYGETLSMTDDLRQLDPYTFVSIKLGVDRNLVKSLALSYFYGAKTPSKKKKKR